MKKFVLLTGSSTGIGEASCQHLVQYGYDVLACVRNPADGDRLRTLFGDQIHPLTLDVVDDEAISKAKIIARQIIGNHPLVAIVNNAGIVVAGAVLYVPVEEWKKQLDVNVLGVIRITQAFFEFLIAAQNAVDGHPRRIINISSVSGLFAAPFIGPYASSKYALEALSDSLRRELYMYDVQVVLIEPGNIVTPIWAKAREGIPHTGPEYESITAFRDKVIDDNLKQGLPASKVADLILQSIRRRKVSPRYLIRAQTWKFKLIRMLPTSWVDGMVKKRLQNKSGFRPY